MLGIDPTIILCVEQGDIGTVNEDAKAKELGVVNRESRRGQLGKNRRSTKTGSVVYKNGSGFKRTIWDTEHADEMRGMNDANGANEVQFSDKPVFRYFLRSLDQASLAKRSARWDAGREFRTLDPIF